MATKDDKPGLLSKVAMFVRNPTRDWSELDQASESDAAGYDKQALKAMIERKRQNDFVRRREFDQLRKLRNRDPGTLASMARPSFFQTSLANDLDGRAVTLKKIDEIEAQMSRQWWKARSQDSQVPTPTLQGDMAPASSASAEEDPKSMTSPAGMSMPFAATAPMSRLPDADPDQSNEFAATVMASEINAASGMLPLEASLADPHVGFSASALFAIETDEIATDPELEEAAIRFANGDDAGAEAGLLAALRSQKPAAQTAQSWALALLDLYRATENQPGFEAAAQEFSVQLDSLLSFWLPIGGNTRVAMPNNAVKVPVWSAAATLDAQAMDELRNAMASQPMPWHLNWTALQSIEASAIPLLGALFDNMCSDAVHMQFDGHEALVKALRDMTPSGDRTVERSCWQMRLDALRAMALQDQFELAALDFCITFEVAPPEWSTAACKVVIAESAPSSTKPAASAPQPTGLAGLGAQTEAAEFPLQGEMQGDASQVLAELDAAVGHSKCLVIDCGNLVRVDFAAAGGLLNWATMRHAEEKIVQFQNVQRLVAAFFNVIGINEYAKVIPRAA